MIDFIKVALDRDTAKQLEMNPLLDFRSSVSHQTGELLPYPKTATFQNLKFKFKSANYCELSGSLHKFAHSGKNYASFTFSEVVDTIQQLQDKFGIDPNRARLKNLEIGINLTELPIAPPDFIRSVLTHKGKAFSEMRSYYGKSIGIECYHQRYGIKVYDKGKQYKLPYPVLRFEVKYTRMHDLNEFGIVYLSDLANPNVWQVFSNQIACRCDEVLAIDPTLQPEALTASERRKLSNYSNPKYWEDLKRDSTKKHDYHRQQYRKLVQRRVATPMQQIIAAKCNEKIQQLSPVSGKNLAKLTNLSEPNISQINTSCKGLPLDTNSTQTSEQSYLQKGQIGEIQKPLSKCQITGTDITDQRTGSKFVSAKKVGYQRAHKTRNRDSNPRNNTRRKILKLKEEHSNALFPLEDVLRLSDEQKRMLSFWDGTKYELQTTGQFKS